MKKLLLTTLVLLSLGGVSFAQQKEPAKVFQKKSAQKARAHNDRIIALKKARQTATPATGEVTKPATAAKKD